MQIVLNGILFCFILLMCLIFGAAGFLLGFVKESKQKKEPAPLSEEQECQIKKREREEENFWSYNGDEQK